MDMTKEGSPINSDLIGTISKLCLKSTKYFLNASSTGGCLAFAVEAARAQIGFCELKDYEYGLIKQYAENLDGADALGVVETEMMLFYNVFRSYVNKVTVEPKYFAGKEDKEPLKVLLANFKPVTATQRQALILSTTPSHAVAYLGQETDGQGIIADIKYVHGYQPGMGSCGIRKIALDELAGQVTNAARTSYLITVRSGLVK